MTLPAFREIKGGEKCPICGRAGRCKVGVDGSDTARLCFRVADEHVNGWHRAKQTRECATYLRDNDRMSAAAQRGDNADLTATAKRYTAAATNGELDFEAGKLGVTSVSLRAIGAGIDDAGHLCFPERDTAGNVVGINTRYPDGAKRVGRGHKRGLTVPANLSELADPVLIVEGSSDTATALTMGLSAVGRPMAKGGVDHLTELLRDREVIIVGENDTKADGTWPGRDGAEYVARKLAESWRRPVAWALPPDGSKDIRAYLCQGRGTDSVELGQRLVEHLRNNRQWTTPNQQRESQRGSRQSDLLVQLASRAELFHDGDEPFASVTVDEHRETWPLHSKGFRRWLTREYHRRYKGAPNSQAMQDTLGVLASQALFDGPELQSAVRLAQHDGVVYLDLCDTDWRAVEIRTTGWRVIAGSDCPLRFIRRRGMLALPRPVTGGSIDDLRAFVNLPDDESWILFVAWLVAALRPVGPFPILVAGGEQGSAKSTLCRVVRALIDPNVAPLRRPPRDERDLMIAAGNSWIIAYDNLSNIRADLSDALSTLATGGGLGTRELYSDDEERLFEAARPIMLNGIGDIIHKADLMDRAISLTLPQISGQERREERELWPAFGPARPRILGALLDAVGMALGAVDEVHLDALPRMADFARWATAGERGLGLAPNAFLRAYHGNRAEGNATTIEASAVGPLIVRLLANQPMWHGTAGELLSAVDEDADERTRRRKDWPKTPQALGNRLRRIAPNLRAIGIETVFTRGSDSRRTRLVRLERVGAVSSESSEPSNNSPGGGKNAVSVGRAPDASDAEGPPVRPNEDPLGEVKNEGLDASDASDAEARTHSAGDAPELMYDPETGEVVGTWER